MVPNFAVSSVPSLSTLLTNEGNHAGIPAALDLTIVSVTAAAGLASFAALKNFYVTNLRLF